MATTPKVLLKRSSVAGRIPDSSDLGYGELAINFADGKLYYKDDANNVKLFGLFASTDGRTSQTQEYRICFWV